MKNCTHCDGEGLSYEIWNDLPIRKCRYCGGKGKLYSNKEEIINRLESALKYHPLNNDDIRQIITSLKENI